MLERFPKIRFATIEAGIGWDQMRIPFTDLHPLPDSRVVVVDAPGDGEDAVRGGAPAAYRAGSGIRSVSSPWYVPSKFSGSHTSPPASSIRSGSSTSSWLGAYPSSSAAA